MFEPLTVRRNPMPEIPRWAWWAAGGAGVAALLLLPTLVRGAPSLPSSSSCHDNAYRWARGKQSMLARWWNGEAKVSGAWVRAYDIGQVTKSFAAVVFPGVPVAAFLGFMANGSLYGSIAENTTENVGTQGFHEMGPFGTEGGPRNGPAPNPNPYAGNNSWGELASNATVVQLLGRSASMVDDAWKTLFRDQAAIGLVNIRAAGRSVNSRIPAPARATDESSLWFVAMAFMGWSAGIGGATSHITRVASSLAGVPDSQKWGAFLRALRAGIQAGTISVSNGAHHTNPAYSANRTWQKLAAGELFASTTSGAGDPWWFDAGFGTETAEYADYFCGKAG